MTVFKRIKTKVFVGCLAFCLGASVATASPLDLATAPLYLSTSVAPNIYLTLDDSGSMAWGFMPYDVVGYTWTKRYKSHSYNAMYYNPAVTYAPPLHADGQSYPNASFTAAWVDGFHTAKGTIDLATSYQAPVQGYAPGYSTNGGSYLAAGTAQPAYYYTYNASCGSVTNDSCYTKVVVSSTSGPNGTDERTNFANWYSYYRLRILTAKTAVSRAFGQLGTDVRVAGQNLNDYLRSEKNVLPADVINNLSSVTGVQMLHPFTTKDGTNYRQKWFDWLIGSEPDGGTPLRSRLQRVGQYFTTSGIDSPYAKDPGVTDKPEYSCRQNFAVVMTDGEWNGETPFEPNSSNFSKTGQSLGNVDDSSGPSISGSQYSYQAHRPYEDDWSSTLADVAMYYWDHDLRPDLTNNVPTYMPDISSPADPKADFYNPSNDPADWQHMETYTIGLGVNGTLDPSKDLGALETGAKTWPEPSVSGGLANIDDLWHAAVNGRGAYISASNPSQLVAAFKSVLSQISKHTSSFDSPALSSGSLTSTTDLFTAQFAPSDWSGHLLATKINSDGSLGSVLWDAACELTGGSCAATGQTGLSAQNYDTGRQIITANPSTAQGEPFRFTDLTSGEQAALNVDPSTGATDNLGAERVDYLRGDRSQEKENGGPFRRRSDVLGDIVHSSPVYVGPPDDAYYDLYKLNPTAFPEGASYPTFEQNNASRIPVVYVGSNDGMLHGFDAVTGKELLGFVPSVLVDKLNKLTSPDYAHRYYVDGTPTAADAYYNNAWHSVLVGGLRGGGKEIYALNVTHPGNFTEANAGNIVMWEFTASKPAPYGDPDLGYTYSRPQVVRLADGKWVAIFGNGYNGADTSGSAHLYIVDLQTGKLIRRIDTPAETDPLVANGTLTSNRPNGLATVEPADVNGDGITDYVYAGDLYGNLWKFDLTSTDPSKWSVAYNAPLFTATDANGNPQPITTKPVVGRNSARPGYMVYFGTGKYLEKSDAVANTGTVQSVYGIWDKNGSKLTPITRSNLQQQQITNEVTQFGYNIRIVTNNPIDWSQQLGWYMDLDPVGVAPQGEMVISAPLLRAGQLIFKTIIPNSDPCTLGGEGWLMEVSAETGGRLNYSPFDFNQDGIFSVKDYAKLTQNGKTELIPGSGRQSTNGMSNGTTILSNCNGHECMYSKGSNGKTDKLDLNTGPNAQGRQSWRQIR